MLMFNKTSSTHRVLSRPLVPGPVFLSVNTASHCVRSSPDDIYGKGRAQRLAKGQNSSRPPSRSPQRLQDNPPWTYVEPEIRENNRMYPIKLQTRSFLMRQGAGLCLVHIIIDIQFLMMRG